ncbi:MAG: thioesterase family protein [Candidatus Pelagadaptatus aseana]|uniref:acyl-CoA thioesterase n=1 Tax=Candidatus Pelagadaptatus aseana TaxID=3120508 RepID=UPI0039B248D4
MHPLLKDSALIYTHTVTWGEMDAFEHVNNTEYFRYFEHARIAHFEKIGMLKYMAEHNSGPILGETRCRFKIPLEYPDTVYIGVKVENLGEDRFTHIYTVVSEKYNAVAAEGEGKIVYYDYNNNCKTALPQCLRQQLES